MRRYLWLALTICAIIFAGGISGTWLGEQMRAPLPNLWGWFGAILAGIAIFGGVNLIVRGDWLGYFIIAATGMATVIMDVMYFWPQHELLAIPLGLFPTALAVLGGMVEARDTARQETQQRATDAQHVARQQRIEDDERAHRHKLEELELRAKLRAATVAQPAPQVAPQPPQDDTATKAERAYALLDETQGSISNSEIASKLVISEGAARTYRSRWVTRNSERVVEVQPVAMNGNGNGAHRD